MTTYRPNGTPVFGAPCPHESERGRDNAVWVCDACGAERPKTAADKALAAPATRAWVDATLAKAPPSLPPATIARLGRLLSARA